MDGQDLGFINAGRNQVLGTLIAVTISLIFAPVSPELRDLLAGSPDALGVRLLALISLGFFLGLVLDMTQAAYGHTLALLVFSVGRRRWFKGQSADFEDQLTFIRKCLRDLSPYGSASLSQPAVLLGTAASHSTDSAEGQAPSPTNRRLGRAEFFAQLSTAFGLLFVLSVGALVAYVGLGIPTDHGQLLVVGLSLVLATLGGLSAKVEYASFVREVWQKTALHAQREQERREEIELHRRVRERELDLRVREVDIKAEEFKLREKELEFRQDELAFEKARVAAEKEAVEARARQLKEDEERRAHEKVAEEAANRERIEREWREKRPHVRLEVRWERHWLFWQKAIAMVSNVGRGVALNLVAEARYLGLTQRYRTFTVSVNALAPGQSKSWDAGNTKDHGACYGISLVTEYQDVHGTRYVESV